MYGCKGQGLQDLTTEKLENIYLRKTYFQNLFTKHISFSLLQFIASDYLKTSKKHVKLISGFRFWFFFYLFIANPGIIMFYNQTRQALHLFIKVLKLEIMIPSHF